MTDYASSSSCARTRPDCLVPEHTGEAGEAARLSPEDIATLTKAREARWRPGLADQPWHSEIFASVNEASGAGLALALARDALQSAEQDPQKDPQKAPLGEAQDRRHILWVQDRRAIERSGRPYLHGLPPELRDRLIHVEAKSPEDALFALEEGLKCRDLACVIGEVVGNPRGLDFTASRRLSLTAEKHGVALWLVRLEAEADLSSARMRWRVEPAPSQTPRWNAEAPGQPRWKAELFRARRHAPGEWMLEWKPSDDQTALSAQRPARDAHSSHDQPDCKQRLGPALARQRRFWHPGGGPALPEHSAQGSQHAPDTRHLVRATVGRSLAARARF